MGDLSQQFPTFADFRVFGRGSVSTVFCATHVKSRLPIAIKQIHKQRLRVSNPADFVDFERSLLKTINHPFIGRSFAVEETEDSIFIVMEFAPNETLLSVLNQGRMPFADVLRYFCQLVCAVSYLHQEKNLVHRDIKIENILLDEFLNVRLIDFGLSKLVAEHDSNLTTICGSIPYCAPEIFQNQPYSKPVDIWSLGVCLYAMVFRKFPFNGATNPSIIDQILRQELELPPYTHPMVADLLSRMLNKSPGDRMTIEEVARHPWIRTSVYSGYFERNFWDSMNNALAEAEVASFFEKAGMDIRLAAEQESEENWVAQIVRRRRVSRAVNPEGIPLMRTLTASTREDFDKKVSLLCGMEPWIATKKLAVGGGRIVFRPRRKPNTLYGRALPRVV